MQTAGVNFQHGRRYSYKPRGNMFTDGPLTAIQVRVISYNNSVIKLRRFDCIVRQHQQISKTFVKIL